MAGSSCDINVIFLKNKEEVVEDVDSIATSSIISMNTSLEWRDVALKVANNLRNGFIVDVLSFDGKVKWNIGSSSKSRVTLSDFQKAREGNTPVRVVIINALERVRQLSALDASSQRQKLRASAGILDEYGENPVLTDSGFSIHISSGTPVFRMRPVPVDCVMDWTT